MNLSEFKIKDKVLHRYHGTNSRVKVPEGVEKIGAYAFSKHIGIRTVELPEGLTTLEQGAFLGCRFLKEVSFPDSLTTVEESAFAGCVSLETVSLPENLKKIGKFAFRNCTRLNKINIPEGTCVEGGSFTSCPLSALDLGVREDFESITDGRLRLLANRCIICGTPLEEMEMAPEDEESLGCPGMRCRHCRRDYTWEKMDHWAYFAVKDGVCTDNICMGGQIPDGVTKIAARAFDAAAVAYLDVPDSVRQIGVAAFMWCDFALGVGLPRTLTRLEEGVFAGSNIGRLHLPEKLQYVGENALFGCDNLQKLCFPKGVKLIGPGTAGQCSSLTEVELNKGMVRLGSRAFSGCPGLKSVHCPGTLMEIGDEAFRDCRELHSLTLNEGLLSLGKRAFFNCENLTEITIPSSVLSIGEGCFLGCSRLRWVRLSRPLGEMCQHGVFEANTWVSYRYDFDFDGDSDFESVDEMDED